VSGSLRISADIGGTFTDIAFLRNDGVLITRKILSTPDDFARAVVMGILELINEINEPPESFSEVLHGCTVATNAILESKGAKTALITTKGFRDVLEMRRIRMPVLYDPLYVKPVPLIPRERRYEIEERLDGNGKIITKINRNNLKDIINNIRDDNVESIAVTLIHSYANDKHERIIGEILSNELPKCFVTLSVDILPEIREYERTSTTAINAYVGPPVKSYVNSLINILKESGFTSNLLMMQSSGGMMDAETVVKNPAQIVECGPAAGVIGSAHLGRLTNMNNLITLDMGGTTAKASLIENGNLMKTDEYEVGGGINLSSKLIKGGGYALKTPVIDISEVGAGGGSIVWIDKVGQLKVGPKSAGASPGPVCYKNKGTEPTLTDANVVLGYLNPSSIAGGTVLIDYEAAYNSLNDKIAVPLNQNVMELAYGIHLIANSTMMRAVKAVSTYRGRDPREFTIIAFGGCGGIHVVELARSLQIDRALIPLSAGVFSALGLLVSDIESTLSRSYFRSFIHTSPDEMNKFYEELEDNINKNLGSNSDLISISRFADMRYEGQAFELTVPVPNGKLNQLNISHLPELFESEHESTYGHRYPGDKNVQIVNLRTTGKLESNFRRNIDVNKMQEYNTRKTFKNNDRKAYFGKNFGYINTPVINRWDLTQKPHNGPIIVEEYENTIVIPPDSNMRLDDFGNILIEIKNKN
jgi:N-methylhydantoinase A